MLTDGLPVEPGHGRALPPSAWLPASSCTCRWPMPLSSWLSALGVGLGGFGYSKPDEGMGSAPAPDLGVRWQADDNLALRVDLAPVIVFAADGGIGPGGHLAVLQGETRF
ncbi:MAG: hypothetical protein U1F43_24255 [Myxococcota bacterium]